MLLLLCCFVLGIAANFMIDRVDAILNSPAVNNGTAEEFTTGVAFHW